MDLIQIKKNALSVEFVPKLSGWLYSLDEHGPKAITDKDENITKSNYQLFYL